MSTTDPQSPPAAPAALDSSQLSYSSEPAHATMATVSPFARSPSLGGSFMDGGRINFTQNVSLFWLCSVFT